MKKVTGVAIALALTIALTACGEKAEQPQTQPPPDDSPQAAMPQPEYPDYEPTYNDDADDNGLPDDGDYITYVFQGVQFNFPSGWERLDNYVQNVGEVVLIEVHSLAHDDYVAARILVHMPQSLLSDTAYMITLPESKEYFALRDRLWYGFHAQNIQINAIDPVNGRYPTLAATFSADWLYITEGKSFLIAGDEKFVIIHAVITCPYCSLEDLEYFQSGLTDVLLASIEFVG